MDHKGIFMKLFPGEEKYRKKKQCTHSSMPRIIKKCMNHQPTTHSQQEPHSSCIWRGSWAPQPPPDSSGPGLLTGASLTTCFQWHVRKGWKDAWNETHFIFGSVKMCKAISHSVMSDSCNPMNCSPLSSSVHGILQARILESVAISFSRGSFRPRDRIQVSCTAGRFFIVWATGMIQKPWVTVRPRVYLPIQPGGSHIW